MSSKYKVFVRNWWKVNKDWPNGLEPDPTARKKVIARGLTEDEAREYCQQYNRNNNPGRLSRKAEFDTM